MKEGSHQNSHRQRSKFKELSHEVLEARVGGVATIESVNGSEFISDKYRRPASTRGKEVRHRIYTTKKNLGWGNSKKESIQKRRLQR
jgi:hypothetical protein